MKNTGIGLSAIFNRASSGMSVPQALHDHDSLLTGGCNGGNSINERDSEGYNGPPGNPDGVTLEKPIILEEPKIVERATTIPRVLRRDR